MIVVINFSHPLNAEAQRIITDEYGAGDAVVHTIKVQLDMAQPLTSQLDALADEALALPEIHGNPFNVDCVILPGHSVAAGYIARRFPTANIIVMASRGLPPVFLPGGLVRPVR